MLIHLRGALVSHRAARHCRKPIHLVASRTSTDSTVPLAKMDAAAGAPKEGSAMADASAWSSTAKSYSSVGKLFTFRYGKAALDLLNIVEGEKVLDVATGPGDIAVHAAATTKASVTAIDFSPGMIEQLKQLSDKEQTPVKALVMDGQALEFADNAFDVVYSCFGVFLFPDHSKGLQEMRRVLQPGGRAAVVSWTPPHTSPMRPWVELLERDFPHALPLGLPDGAIAMSTPKGLKAAMEAAGFSRVSVQSETHRMVLPSTLEAFAEPVLQNPVMLDVKKKLDPAEWDQLLPKFCALMESAYKADDGEISFDAVALIAVCRA